MSRRKNREVPTDPFDLENENSTRRKPARKKRRIWPWALLALVLFVFFLPTIVGSTSLRQTAVDYALGDFDGKVTIDKVSLGWFSPIKIEGVKLFHQDAAPIISIASIKSSKPLFKFLTGDDYGEIEISKPLINVVLHANGSNIEDAIVKLLPTQADDDSDTTKLPTLSVKCVDGVANVVSTTANESWTIDSFNVVARTSMDEIPLAIDGECRFLMDGDPIGGLAYSAQVDNGAETLTFSSAQLALSSHNLPLALVAPIFQRFVGPTTTIGHMTSELQLAYDANSTQVAINVNRLEVIGAGIAAPEFIGQDKLYTETLTARGQVNLSPQQISADQFELVCDFGNIKANGVFDANQLNNLVAGGELLNTPFSMSGKIDIARVAGMIPNTLQLYDDLNINSGVISFHASSTQQDESQPRRIVLNVDSANIRARRGNQDIVWQKPLRLVGTVNQSNGQLAFEDVRVISDFLTIGGEGSLGKGRFDVGGDLAKLVDRVGQFADLGGLQMSGKLTGSLGWEFLDDGSTKVGSTAPIDRSIQLSGRFDVTNPIINWPQLPQWNPQRISVQMQDIQLQGIGNSGEKLQVKRARFDVQVGTEQLIAALSEPVADFWNAESWKLNCQMTGELAGWLGHAKNFVDIGNINGSGQLELSCVAMLDANSLRMNRMQFEVQPFGFDGYGMTVKEPKVDGKTNLTYDLTNGQLVFKNFSATGKSISVNGQEFKIRVAENVALDGTVFFHGDVNRVAEWYGLSTKPTDIYWYGNAKGSVAFNSNTKQIGGKVEALITDLVAGQKVAVAGRSRTPSNLVSQKTEWKELWREPKVNINSNLVLGADYDSVAFKNLKVNSSSLQMSTQGTIHQLTGAMITDLSGSWNPNWQLVNSLLDAYTGKRVKFTGGVARPFVMKGPIFAPEGTQNAAWISPQLQIQTAIGWEKAEVLKLPLGRNRLAINLNQSFVDLNVHPISVGGGKLQLSPRLDLRSESPWLVVGQGVIADQIELTPETCRNWLKFIAPLAADATSAHGKFSVSTSGVHMPLMDPLNVEARGLVRLSEVTIGAGPLAEQLLATANQLKLLLKPGSTQSPKANSSWLQMGQQDIPVAIQNRRVYHDGLTINHKEIQIRTKGSVGMDQTISLVAEIPIVDSWIAGEPWLAGLRGQSISIPVSGTVTAPRLDRRAIQQLSQQLIRQAAGSAINKVVDDKLGGAQRVINDQLNKEVNKAQESINNKLQKQVGEKLENELRDGLNSLFKKGGDKK